LFLQRTQEIVFTEETGDGIYIRKKDGNLEETGDGIYSGHRRLYLQRTQEIVFTEETGDGIYIGNRRWYLNKLTYILIIIVNSLCS